MPEKLPISENKQPYLMGEYSLKVVISEKGRPVITSISLFSFIVNSYEYPKELAKIE